MRRALGRARAAASTAVPGRPLGPTPARRLRRGQRTAASTTAQTPSRRPRRRCRCVDDDPTALGRQVAVRGPHRGVELVPARSTRSGSAATRAAATASETSSTTTTSGAISPARSARALERVDAEPARDALVRERRRRVPIHTTTVPRASAGRITSSTCCARSASTSNNSARASIARSSCNNSARIAAPTLVPPGSNVSTTSRPRRATRRRAAHLRALAAAFAAFEHDEPARASRSCPRLARGLMRRCMRRPAAKPERIVTDAAEREREPHAGQRDRDRCRDATAARPVRREIVSNRLATNGAIVNDSNRHSRTIV